MELLKNGIWLSKQVLHARLHRQRLVTQLPLQEHTVCVFHLLYKLDAWMSMTGFNAHGSALSRFGKVLLLISMSFSPLKVSFMMPKLQ